MPNHRDCFGSRKPSLLNFCSWQEIQKINQPLRRKKELRCNFQENKIAGPHLSCIRKAGMSRVSICGHRETSQTFLSQMGPGWRLPAPPRSGCQQCWMAGPQPSQAHQEQAAKQNSHPDLQIVPVSGLQVENRSTEVLQ